MMQGTISVFSIDEGVFCFSHLQIHEFTLAELKEFYILALGSVVLSKLQDSRHLHVCIFPEYQFSFPTQLAYSYLANTNHLFNISPVFG